MITKFTIDRLVQRRPELSLDCPNCGGARLTLGPGAASGDRREVECPKCGVIMMLDALSVTVVNERAATVGSGSELPAIA